MHGNSYKQAYSRGISSGDTSSGGTTSGQSFSPGSRRNHLPVNHVEEGLEIEPNPFASWADAET